MSADFLNRVLFFATACVVFFPRVSVSGISVSFSGLDFSPIIIFFHFLFLLWLRGRNFLCGILISIKESLFGNGISLYFSFFVSLMMLFPFLFYFLNSFEFDPFFRSVLQFYRHLAVLMVCVYFHYYYAGYGNKNKPANFNSLFRFDYVVFLVMLVGVVFSFLIAIGQIPFLSPASDLTATSVFSDESSMLRFEGFSGSPTPFAVVCLISLVYVFYVKRNYGGFALWFVFLSVPLLSVCILLTFSKSVLVFWFFIVIAFLFEQIKFGLVLNSLLWLGALLLLLAAITVLVGNPLVLDLFYRGVVSGSERFDIYANVISVIVENPVRWFIGSGWKSAEVGAHNEQLELLLAFGLPFGIISFVSLLLCLFKFVVFVSFDRYIVFIFLSMLIFSLFQEIFWNPSVMLVFMLFMIRIRHIKVAASIFGFNYSH